MNPLSSFSNKTRRDSSHDEEVLPRDQLVESRIVRIEKVLEDANMGFLDKDFNEEMISALQGFQENEVVKMLNNAQLLNG
ncbi:hypothetical protein SUGI_1145060 [Cryptomeria japonica]|nr:hypothetical protein SUGI_1145060 [Cryptomeria japonica]